MRFWRRGETQAHTGFTINVSQSGLFLGTGHPLNPGERVRLELVDADRGFVAEGKVARVHRVALALRHVQQPGVGIRFLSPEDLVAELVPGARAATGGRRSWGESSGGPAAGDARAPLERPPAVEPEAAPADAPGDEFPGLEVIPVDFVDASSFLAVYHRDISSGGLFLSTPSPAELNQVVVVELRIPGSGSGPLRLEARVVQRIEPTAAVGRGQNLLAGMGVQFLEPERVIEQLQPTLAALRR